MQQGQTDLQLKVWKELAISKQMLMRSAAEALKLSPDCSQDELKQALESALKKVAEADANVRIAQEQARITITDMESKLSMSEKGRIAAEFAAAELLAKQDRAAQQLQIERTGAAKEAQQLKDRITEREKALKAINAALADTPENVIKKLKALRKEKQDEAELRRQVEASLNTLRKEKREQEQLVKTAQDNGVKLATQHRELHAISVKLHEQLTAADGKDLPILPELDGTLLESIEQPDAEKSNSEKKK